MNVDFSEVQAHVLLGFKEAQQALVFFRITNPDAFRAKLPWFEGALTWTEEALPLWLANTHDGAKATLAFAFRGLAKLLAYGDTSWLGQQSASPTWRYVANGKSAFAEDCYARANEVLLDSSDDLSRWVVGGPDNAPDGVLILAEPTKDAVKTSAARIAQKLDDCVMVTHAELGDRLTGREHFGFRDGVSNQSVDVSDVNRPALKLRVVANPLQHHPGEALLLSQAAVAGMPAWLEFSSYLVFRRLDQDVPGFHRSIADAAVASNESIANIATRVLGRSRDGDSPIVAPSNSPSDNFDYAADPNGNACPFSAHARRANPRTATSRDVRPIFRRSVAYGPPSPSTFDNPQLDAEPTERGLLFLCYQSSIESQFEYVTRHWLNNHESFPSPIDALLGKQAGKAGVREIDLGVGQPVQLAHHVRPTGAGYFLTPAKTSLRKILAV